MKKIERKFLEDFERTLGDTTTFEDIEERLPLGAKIEKFRRPRKGLVGIIGVATAAVLLTAAVLPTVFILGRTRQNDPFDSATVEYLRENDCLFFEELVFAESSKNHVFVLRAGEIAEHYSYEKQVYRDGSFENVKNMSMVEAVKTIGIPSYAGSGELSLDYSFNDGYIRRVDLEREDGKLTVKEVEVLDKEDPTTWLDPDKASLPTREQCEQIAVGMSFDEVVRRIGRPQRDVGSGAILYQFDVEGGAILQMRLDSDVQQENKYVHNNPNVDIYGTHFLYVGSVGFSDFLPDIHDWGKQ